MLDLVAVQMATVWQYYILPREFPIFAMGGPRGLISLNSNLNYTQLLANKPVHGNTDTPFSSNSC